MLCHEVGHIIFNIVGFNRSPVLSGKTQAIFNRFYEAAKREGGVSSYSRAWRGDPGEVFSEIAGYRFSNPQRYRAVKNKTESYRLFDQLMESLGQDFAQAGAGQ
jgi:hypothetical protein